MPKGGRILVATVCFQIENNFCNQGANPLPGLQQSLRIGDAIARNVRPS